MLNARVFNATVDERPLFERAPVDPRSLLVERLRRIEDPLAKGQPRQDDGGEQDR